MGDTSSTTTGPRPRWLMAALIIFTLLCMGLLVPAAGMAMFSPMISDSGVSFAIYGLIASFVAAPVVVIMCPIVGWIGFWRSRIRLVVGAMLALPIFGLALAAQLLLWDAI